MGTLVFQATLGGSVNLIGPNTASTINFTLPSADGTSGQALTTNGSGTLSFATVTTGAAGSTTQVQYNSSGAFAGSANLTFNGTTLTAANTSITTSETLSYGTANGVTYLNGSKVLTSGSALQFDGTNLGLGVTPSAWSTYKAFQVGTGSLFNATVGGTDYTIMASNAYTDTSSTYKYIGSNFATAYYQFGGKHAWFNAPSGTAGNAISFTQAMLLDASGNLGLNTTPSAVGAYKIMEINGTTGGIVYLQTNGTRVAQWYGSSSEGGIGQLANAPFLFYTNNTERARISATGDLLVGVTTAVTGYKMHISGAVYQDQTANGTSGTPLLNGGYVCGPGDANVYAGIRFLNSYLSNNASQLAFYVTNTTGSAYEAGRFDSSGNLLVGTTTAVTTNVAGVMFAKVGTQGRMTIGSTSTAAQDLAYFFNPNGIVGSIQTNGSSTSYVTSSDYRLKNSIAPMTGALAKVAQLKPCTYKWNADGSDGEGFIAHELAEVCPHAVTGEKDAVDEEGNPKYQGIDTSFLVATLTAAIQELKAEFDAYKASHP